MNITAQQLYLRQTTLPEIGEVGQHKLNQAKVLVVGCGGLGSVAAVYLAGSGIGYLHLIDFDVVSETNLHRQVFYTIQDIGKSKSEVLKNHINNINPLIQVSISQIALNKENVFEAFANYDIILDCTDNLKIKYLINDACVLLDKMLVYGSLYKFDGYVASFNLPESNGKRSANLRDAFPEIPTNYIPNCSESGTLNSIVGIIGLMQTNEVLKIVTGIGKPVKNALLIYNSLENSQFKMKLEGRNNQLKIKEFFENENYLADTCDWQEEALLIDINEFKAIIDAYRNNWIIISVAENFNILYPFKVDLQLPLSSFDPNEIKFQADKKYLFICQRGITSYTATEVFKEFYPEANAFNLKNGLEKY